jgi:hypothetical protein
MSLPKPTKVSADGSPPVYGCIYNPGHICKIASSNVRCGQQGYTLIRIPLAFQKKCRKEILSRHEDIRAWFNPRPSIADLERYVSTPDTHTVTERNDDKDIVGLKMEGILIDNGRIYPKYEVVWEQKPGLVMSLDDDLVEVTDLDVPGEEDATAMVLKAPRNERYYEDDGDEDDTEDDGDDDGDDDDADDDDDGMTDAIRKIQDSIDIAREELAKLARTRRK